MKKKKKRKQTAKVANALLNNLDVHVERDWL
jgi:hypothetical protein